MKKYILSILALVCFTIIACKETKKEAPSEEDQMELVMEIHDEVMPKMGKINTLIKDLGAEIKTGNTTEAYTSAKADLQEANTLMMDWMTDFSERFDSDEIMDGKALSPEKQEWLDEEEEKIRRVRDKINSSIAKAEALLEQ